VTAGLRITVEAFGAGPYARDTCNQAAALHTEEGGADAEGDRPPRYTRIDLVTFGP